LIPLRECFFVVVGGGEKRKKKIPFASLEKKIQEVVA